MKIKYVTKHEYWVKISNNSYMLVPLQFAWDGDSCSIDFKAIASCVHDIGYATKGNITITDGKGNYSDVKLSRRTFDRIYERLTKAPIPKLRYIILRSLGWIFWGNQTVITVNADLYDKEERCEKSDVVFVLEEDELYTSYFYYYVM
jgi:hypothetical protein